MMDWIVQKGTVRIPDGVSFEQACFVEPVNTCLKGIAHPATGTRGDSAGNRPRAYRVDSSGVSETGRRTGDYFRFVSGEAYNSS